MPTASPYLELLPAVDVAGGQAVQLVQGVAGSEKRFGDPVEAALNWQNRGAEWLHLVDLDAAFGRGHNRELLAQIVGTLDIKVERSGGIRDDHSLKAAMATGCTRVNIGTAALENPEWCAHAITTWGDRVAVGLDVRAGPSPHAAGPATAATCSRPSHGSMPRAVPATSSPTSPRTAPSRAPTWSS
jgi:phosphoribosylanthranilate isomerase